MSETFAKHVVGNSMHLLSVGPMIMYLLANLVPREVYKPFASEIPSAADLPCEDTEPESETEKFSSSPPRKLRRQGGKMFSSPEVASPHDTASSAVTPGREDKKATDSDGEEACVAWSYF